MILAFSSIERTKLALFCLVVLTVGVAGCSGKPNIDFGKVSGQVKFKGEPLPNATVCFIPSNGRPSYSKTDPDGRYSIQYKGEDWGAVVGSHTVKITTEDRIEDMVTGKVQSFPEILPAKYHANTELTAEVKGGENVIDFDLKK